MPFPYEGGRILQRAFDSITEPGFHPKSSNFDLGALTNRSLRQSKVEQNVPISMLRLIMQTTLQGIMKLKIQHSFKVSYTAHVTQNIYQIQV